MAASDPPFAAPRFKCVLGEAAEVFQEIVVRLQSSRQVPGAQDSGPDSCISNVPADSNSVDMASSLQDIDHEIWYMQCLCDFVTGLGSRAGEALRHDRFRTALLQLLAVLVRLDNLLLPPVQGGRANAHSYEQQQLPDEGRAGEHAHAPHGGGLAPEGTMRCAQKLLSMLTGLLRAVSIPLWCSSAGRGTAAGVGCGSSESSGPAADTSATHQLLLGLEFGCALLRMHTLQCCSRQVAAVCTWLGGDGQEQEAESGHEEQQQQRQQEEAEAQVHGEQQGSAGIREQPRTRQSEVFETLNTVSGVVDLIYGHMSLARAALRVLQGDETLSAGLAADAAAVAAAQHADCRRLSRHFLLLLASNMRDSHLLEHCARAAVVAVVWQQRCRPGSRTSGEAAEGQGQGATRQEAGGGESCPQGLLGLLQGLVQAIGGAGSLLPFCERAPAPASTVVGPAVRQALAGPCVVHLASILGLRALCTADGGPDYGMPVSYRAVPAEYGRWQAGCQEPYSREQHVLTMTSILGITPPPVDVAQARREVRERLVLLLRACDVAVASAVGRGGQEEEERVGGGGGGCRAGDGLVHMLAQEELMLICFEALWAGNKLLDVCWELVKVAGAPRPLGDGLVQAGAGSAGQVSAGVAASLALPHPGQVTGAAAAVATGMAAAGAAAATQAPAGAADGAPTKSVLQLAVEQLPADRRKALSLAALRAHQVRWWRRVCAAVTHVLPVAWRLPSYSEKAAEAQEFTFAAWLGLVKMELPDPAKGEPSTVRRSVARDHARTVCCLETCFFVPAAHPTTLVCCLPR